MEAADKSKQMDFDATNERSAFWNEEEIDGAVPCPLGAINPDQQDVEVRQRELIAESDVANTAGVEVEDLMENRLASRTPFERLRRDADVKTERQVYGAWMEHMVAGMRMTWRVFMEACVPAGSPRQQVVNQNRWTLRVLSQSGFVRGKQQWSRQVARVSCSSIKAGDAISICAICEAFRAINYKRW